MSCAAFPWACRTTWRPPSKKAPRACAWERRYLGSASLTPRFDILPSSPVSWIIKETVKWRRVSMATEFPSKNGIKRQWHVIDAQNVVLGKLASKAAMVLMGKTKPAYTTFLDTGDHVIVINAAKVKVTGRKEEDKLYRHFTGYPGGLVEKSLKRVRAEKPVRLVEDAIAGMLPKTKLGKQMFRKLQVYAGDKHPHAAQQPTALAVR